VATFTRRMTKIGEQDVEKNQFNPKIRGLLDPFWTVRCSGWLVFRTLKRTLITDQTLEPTQVAGFNQFFDEGNATEAWVYGAAVDQRFSQKIYAGAEFSSRDLDVPWYSGIPPVAQIANWNEYLGVPTFTGPPTSGWHLERNMDMRNSSIPMRLTMEQGK